MVALFSAMGAGEALACGATEIVSANVLVEGADSKNRGRFTLGYMMEVPGTSYSLMALEESAEDNDAFGCGSASSQKNFLFVDGTTNEQRWLLGHNDYLVEFNQVLTTNPESEEPWKVQAIMYVVTKKPTTGDARRTKADLKTIAFSKHDGSGYTEIVTDVEGVFGGSTNSNGDALIVYQRNSSLFSAIVDSKSFEIKNESEVPKVGS